MSILRPAINIMFISLDIKKERLFILPNIFFPRYIKKWASNGEEEKLKYLDLLC